MASRVGDFIEANREQIVQRWADLIFATTAPTSLPRAAAIDSGREFLAALARVLREDAGLKQTTNTKVTSAVAKEHGKQRFGLGYDIGALVREYGLLREVLFQLLEERGLVPDPRENRVLSKYLVNAIADAVGQYALERDEELRQQASRHMSFLAHELRNPLSSARLALQGLEQQGLLPPGRLASVLTRSLHRVNELIDNTLVELRLKSVTEPRREWVDLGALFQELAEDCAADLEHKRIHLNVEAPSGVVIHADRKLLHSALSNLLRNAVKFTHPGGTLHLRLKQADNRVAVDVEDECGGLAEDRMQALFSPFVQIGQNRSGFGLGLAIARQAAEANGGELRVHNLPGRGCVFVLDLPIAPQPPAPSRGDDTAGAGGPRG
jgi:signal transduction histidine kinase